MDLEQKKSAGAEYSISEVSRLTGYSVDTLRFYEKAGLLPGVARRGGRRRYSVRDCHALGIITCLKNTGMPLDEIRRYMELGGRGEDSVDERLAIMRRQQDSIEERMRELQLCRERIAFKVWYYETARKEGLAGLQRDIEATLERYRRETKRNVSFDTPQTRKSGGRLDEASAGGLAIASTVQQTKPIRQRSRKQ
mgnify:CR=1 FL=1